MNVQTPLLLLSCCMVSRAAVSATRQSDTCSRPAPGLVASYSVDTMQGRSVSRRFQPIEPPRRRKTDHTPRPVGPHPGTLSPFALT